MHNAKRPAIPPNGLTATQCPLLPYSEHKVDVTPLRIGSQEGGRLDIALPALNRE
jgi:hypothetical protein